MVRGSATADLDDRDRGVTMIRVTDWQRWQTTKLIVCVATVLTAIIAVAFGDPTTDGVDAVVLVSCVGISAGLVINLMLTSIQRIAETSQKDDFWM